jgi:hypothetical protein
MVPIRQVCPRYLLASIPANPGGVRSSISSFSSPARHHLGDRRGVAPVARQCFHTCLHCGAHTRMGEWIHSIRRPGVRFHKQQSLATFGTAVADRGRRAPCTGLSPRHVAAASKFVAWTALLIVPPRQRHGQRATSRLPFPTPVSFRCVAAQDIVRTQSSRAHTILVAVPERTRPARRCERYRAGRLYPESRQGVSRSLPHARAADVFGTTRHRSRA